MRFQNKRIKFCLSIFCGVFITVLLHQVFEDPVLDVTKFPPSIVVQAVGSFKPLLVISLLIAYGLIACFFVVLYHDIPAPAKHKGLVYGASLGGMWIIGMTEMTPWTNTPWYLLTWSGFSDFAGIVVMGYMLGKLFFDDSADDTIAPKTISLELFIIPALFVIGRYFSYMILKIDSGVGLRPVETFIWTLSMGIWIWCMYYFLGVGNWNRSPFQKTIIFGVVLFGVIWTLFDAIGCLISSYFNIFDSILRTGFDLIIISTAVFISAQIKTNVEDRRARVRLTK